MRMPHFFLPTFCATFKVKVNQPHYRPEVPRGFQEFKVPRLRDNGPLCNMYCTNFQRPSKNSRSILDGCSTATIMRTKRNKLSEKSE